MGMLILALVVTGVSAELLFRNVDEPLPMTMVVSAIAFGAAALRARATPRVVGANVAMMALVVLGFETWVDTRDPDRGSRRHHKAEYAEGYFQTQDSERGYGPSPNRASASRKVFGEEVFYAVTYTIDEHGLRVTPSSDADSSILFFGGSYTFGEGLNDEETFPYRVGQAMGEEARVYNFGFHGYGPHQMLATLNGTFIDEVVEAPPRAIVFLTAAFHMHRVTGTSWDRSGPRFRLDTEGRAVRDGTFADVGRLARLTRSLRIRLSKSGLGRRIVARVLSTDQGNFSLYVAIVVAARDRARERYPESRFDVLIWDRSASRDDRIVAALEEAGITVHRLSEVLPDFREDRMRYVIHEFDGHPNEYATRLIADYALQSIAREPTGP